MLPKESHALVFHEGHSIAPVHVQFQLTISFLNCMFVVARLSKPGDYNVMHVFYLPVISDSILPAMLANIYGDRLIIYSTMNYHNWHHKTHKC